MVVIIIMLFQYIVRFIENYKKLSFVTFHDIFTILQVGPPFACAGDFDGTKSYIDLGQWSPGSKYTIAAWVRPELVNNGRRV